MSFHRTEVIGNLTDDPEMKYVGETPKTTFSVAVNEKRGERERVTYYDIECWDKLAQTVAEYMRKGRKVFVAGRMQMDQWEDNEGTKRRKWYLRADTVQFLGERPHDEDERPRRRRQEEERPRRRSRDDEDEEQRERDRDRYSDLPF